MENQNELELHFCKKCEKENLHKITPLIDKIVDVKLVGAYDNLEEEEIEVEVQIGINIECTVCKNETYKLF